MRAQRSRAFRPEQLWPGEAILWQGAPSWRALARDFLRARWVAAYFLVLLVWKLVLIITHPTSLAAASVGTLVLLVDGGGAVDLLLLLAWGIGRTTVYTITNMRIIMRYGMALPAVLDIPLRAIAEMGLRVHADHTGDVALRLKAGQRIAYHRLWPHARGWRLLAAEPMLRSIPQAGVVGPLLARALAARASAGSSGPDPTREMRRPAAEPALG